MNDDQILERGGTEEDIENYAKQNGADLEEEDICQCETWGGDRGCLECVEKENMKNPDWTIQSRSRFKKGEVTLWCKNKMTQPALDNMLKTLVEEIEITNPI